MANYQQGNRWSADINTDSATLTAAAKGGSGAGGTTTVISGGGPNGEDIWEYVTLGASAQRHITVSGLNLVVNTTVGIWLNLTSYTNLKKCFIFLGQGGFVDYFAHTITANDLEGNRGWVFITRPKSQFASHGSADWANPIDTIRIGVTAEAAASGGETMRVGPLYTHLNTRPKVIVFMDDSNDTDYTEAYAYMQPKGLYGVTGVIQSNIDTTNFLSTSNINTMMAAGWDFVGHEITEFDTLTYAEQVAKLQAIKSYLQTLGSSSNDLFVLPGGKYDTNTIPACEAAGITAMRTTIQFSYSPAISPNMYDFHAMATAVTTGTTSTDWLAALDDAIANNATFATFNHGLYAAATGIHTNLAEWKLYIDGIESRVNAGLVDCVTWSEYISGLNDIIWAPPAGSLY